MTRRDKMIRDCQYLLHNIIKGTARILLQLYLIMDRRAHIYCSNIFDGRSLIIFSNGFISCTSRDNEMEHIMGDLSDKSIFGIWDGERYETTRKSFSNNRLPFNSCVACPGLRVENRKKPSFTKTNFPFKKQSG